MLAIYYIYSPDLGNIELVLLTYRLVTTVTMNTFVVEV